MSYDLEKYRDKREKVLGVKRRGLSFQLIVGVFAFLIIFSTGFIFIPDAVSHFRSRNLDDAIYKLEKTKPWESRIVESVKLERGVKNVEISAHGMRLTLTFNREKYSLDQFESIVKREGFFPILLNRMDHNRRMNILDEEKEFEAL
ncbi:MAG: hypothetical protein GY760_05410 [Deltaproteobacteria bacterium]|nr:hypothetical protein [Deltaproteobacteria bacterium]